MAGEPFVEDVDRSGVGSESGRSGSSFVNSIGGGGEVREEKSVPRKDVWRVVTVRKAGRADVLQWVRVWLSSEYWTRMIETEGVRRSF